MPGLHARRLVGLVVAIGATVAVLALALLQSGDGDVDPGAHRHAEAACRLTAQAQEAARVDSSARFAAAMLLLDKAIEESARAAAAAPELEDLDRALQAAHTASHQSAGPALRDELDTARAACRGSLD